MMFQINESQGTWPDTLFPGMTMESSLIVILVIVLWFISGYLLGAWVKKDIREHESVGTAYVILVYLTSIIGLTFYLLMRYNAKCALAEDEAACEIDEIRKED